MARCAEGAVNHVPKMLFREDMDSQQCSAPDCDHQHEDEMVIHSMCHVNAPTWATYNRESGTILVTCAICERPIVGLVVASRGAIH